MGVGVEPDAPSIPHEESYAEWRFARNASPENGDRLSPSQLQRTLPKKFEKATPKSAVTDGLPGATANAAPAHSDAAIASAAAAFRPHLTPSPAQPAPAPELEPVPPPDAAEP